MPNRIIYIFIIIFGFIHFAVMAEEPLAIVTDEQVKAMVERATPLIEDVTGHKFKSEVVWKVVKRDVVRDALTKEFLPQLTKLLGGLGEDLIARQAEMTAQVTSQSLLGKYSLLTKELYIVPDNIKTITTILGVKDEDIEAFVFLVVVHEMVHSLDDQYYDLQKIIESRSNVENTQAFNAFLEGHAVYVTNKVADRLNISEVARQSAVKSVAGIQNGTDRQQQQLFQSIYVKGSEFVEAIRNCQTII